MNVYVFLSVQSEAFGSRQFSNQQAMNIKSLKITQSRATGGHLVNRCLRMILSPCSLLVSISKTEMYVRQREWGGKTEIIIGAATMLFSFWIF